MMSKLTSAKRYIIYSHLDESANVEWMDYSGRAGGSIGVGWVLILQPEDGQRTFKIYAMNYSILQYGILDVRVPV